VLLAERNADLIPKYLSFVMGVVDSNDLNINVARETLQNSKTFKIINQRLTKKILDMISEIADYEEITEEEVEDELEEPSEELALMEDEELEKKKTEARDKLLKDRKQRY
jgi:heat shock protein beta